MKFITCKDQNMVRKLTTRTPISGFYGPAAASAIDDGYGHPVLKDQVFDGYAVYYNEAGKGKYDSTFEVPDIAKNRETLAACIRSGDYRVVDRALEKEILRANPPVNRRAKAKLAVDEMPSDFDGSKIKAVEPFNPNRDNDPIEDPFAEDAVFTEVAKEEQAVSKPYFSQSGIDDGISTDVKDLEDIELPEFEEEKQSHVNVYDDDHNDRKPKQKKQSKQNHKDELDNLDLT